MTKPVGLGTAPFVSSNTSIQKKICGYPDCRKKVSTVFENHRCKCEQQFCLDHFDARSHNCTFDWTAYRKNIPNLDANIKMAEQARKKNLDEIGDVS